MKVLVTGGCGFIGSHVCEFYTKLGAEVISYDNMTKHELARTGYNAAAARDYTWNLLNELGVKLIKADVRDRDTLRQASQGCDFISDITKAQKVLAWRPRILPEEGVKRLLSWVEENLYLFKSSAK